MISIKGVFTNPPNARSSSCLLFLCPEILNISTSPHEFKMNSHISAAAGLSSSARRGIAPVTWVGRRAVPAQECFSTPLTTCNDSKAWWESVWSRVFYTHIATRLCCFGAVPSAKGSTCLGFKHRRMLCSSVHARLNCFIFIIHTGHLTFTSSACFHPGLLTKCLLKFSKWACSPS